VCFWRYKANAQRAAREGDFKYLKIFDNTFLFNVAEDQREVRQSRADGNVTRKTAQGIFYLSNSSASLPAL
jgi:hypothetical protein